ncbi:MAG TPA: 4-(cytidine 5'-diphospho)-2-C-methyl-D-erythritol kinase [Pirellulales bacterium]|nr:4-(cytidine 5'-diphospho)-2-C-methyl-D-erythritol kinase [Pirellulales bacterium]
MHVRSTATGLEVLAPAKLNLFLEVLGKRDDGFHEIETLMVPIGLFDTLHFQLDPSGRIVLDCRTTSPYGGTASPYGVMGEQLPAGSENIVVRAVDLVRRRFAVPQGARVRLIKRIPMAAGMAGGSSDAAAALVAICHLWELSLSFEQLSQLAEELGSDVPFFLGRGAAVCRGRGERLEPVAGLGNLWFVVVKPPEGLSTADVYRACHPAERPRRVEALIEALRAGRLARAGAGLRNALQPAAETLSPWVRRLSREFASLDCLGHQMSGSGTSYFGLCRHARHARRVAACLRARGVGQCYAVQGTN